MAGDRGIAAAMVRNSPAPGRRVSSSIGTDGARRLKLKGALVVYLDAEFTVDQLTRWVKTTLITDDVSEEDFAP
jgi:hypothetical protein